MPTFTKRIIRPGTYTVPRADGTRARVHIGPQRISKWLSTFDAMKKVGLGIPAPWRHEEKALPVRLDGDQKDTNAFNNAGFWKRLWVDDKDGSLYGEVDVPREEDADRLGKTVVDVSLLAKPKWVDGSGNEYDDALTHIALVTHPVAKDHDNFRPSPSESEAIACSLCDLLMAEDVTPAPSGGAGNASIGDGVKASSATVKDALTMLSKMDPPITLPEDTNSQNFLERLVTALNALSAAAAAGDEEDKNTSISEPPSGSKEKPGPIAMANEPKEPLKLSAEDQAAINWARKTSSVAYQSRIEACVKQGKITPKLAKETALPLLKDLQLSFDAEGQPVKTPLDMVLEAWEAIPANSVLTGRSPRSARATKGSVFTSEAFSLTAGMEEIGNAQLDDESDPTEEKFALTEEEADKIVDEQFKASGVK